MHETSLINFTLDAVEKKAAQMGITHVSDVRLIVGELKGAVPELLEYAFQILAGSREMFEGAELDIELRPAVLKCRDCGREFHAGLSDFADAKCPSCGSASREIIAGDELRIDSFSGE